MMRTIKLSILFSIIFFFCMSFSSEILQDDAWPVPAKYAKLKNPYIGAEDGDQIGRELYLVHCRSCHGTKGKGDGKKASTLETEVTDITTDNFKSQTDGEIYYKSFIGKGDMPSFENKIKIEEDRWLLVNYIRTL